MEKNKNKSDFNVPEGYFQKFEDRLLSKLAEESFPKTGGFKTPDCYFQNFDSRISEKISTTYKYRKAIPLFPQKYFGYAAAIAACIVVGFSIFSIKPLNSNLDTPQSSAIASYIEDGNLNLDLYDLTSFLEEEDVANMDFDMKTFKNSLLKEYLLENIDTETLINEQ